MFIIQMKDLAVLTSIVFSVYAISILKVIFHGINVIPISQVSGIIYHEN